MFDRCRKPLVRHGGTAAWKICREQGLGFFAKVCDGSRALADRRPIAPGLPDIIDGRDNLLVRHAGADRGHRRQPARCRQSANHGADDVFGAARNHGAIVLEGGEFARDSFSIDAMAGGAMGEIGPLAKRVWSLETTVDSGLVGFI